MVYIVKGNYQKVNVHLVRLTRGDETVMTPWSLIGCSDVRAKIVSDKTSYEYREIVISEDGERLSFEMSGREAAGEYGVEVTFRDTDGLQRRTYVLAQIAIVRSVEELGVDQEAAIEAETLTLDVAIDAGLAPEDVKKFFEDQYTRSQVDELLGGKVDKEPGKGLSTNDYTTAEKEKLASTPTSFAPVDAEKNVQADWNATSGDAMILNKPKSLPASDVAAWAKEPTKPTYTAQEVGALPDSTVIPDPYDDSEIKAEVAKKVDKEAGKGLSTNDYTTAEKQKLENLPTQFAPVDAEKNVQADWNATSGDAQILNKPSSLPASDVAAWAKAPTKPTYTAQEVGALPDSTKIPTKVSELENDSKYITIAVADLVNYYRKAETYTKEEVDALLSAIPKFSIEVVESLPMIGISETTVYLVPEKDAKSPNMYTEYIYAKGAWEMLGTQSVDLSGYVKSEAISDMLTKTEANNTYLGKSASASSAIKLANARTLWGQSFDGTADVKGNMSGVGSIAMNGVLSGARGEIKGVKQVCSNLAIDSLLSSNSELVNGELIIRPQTSGSDFGVRISTLDDLSLNGHRLLCHVRMNADLDYDDNHSNSWRALSMTLGDTLASQGTVRIDILQYSAYYANMYNHRYVNFDTLMDSDTNKHNKYISIYLRQPRGDKQELHISQCYLFDLTAMFGTGNEPTTATEFANRLGYASIEDVPYIPYTAEPIELNNAMAIGGDLVVNGTPLKGDMIATKTAAELTTETTKVLEVGKVVNFGEVTTLNISLAEPTQKDVVNEYGFVFTAGVNDMTYTMPTSVKWEVGKGAPTITAGHTYEVSIIDGCATYLEFV